MTWYAHATTMFIFNMGNKETEIAEYVKERRCVKILINTLSHVALAYNPSEKEPAYVNTI